MERGPRSFARISQSIIMLISKNTMLNVKAVKLIILLVLEEMSK
jgi:hypothetical protein